MRAFVELEQFPFHLRDHVEERHDGDREADRYYEAHCSETHHRHNDRNEFPKFLYFNFLFPMKKRGVKTFRSTIPVETMAPSDRLGYRVAPHRTNQCDSQHRDHRLLGIRAVLSSQVPSSESRATDHRQSKSLLFNQPRFPLPPLRLNCNLIV